jgi:30S ribosomal protein S31
MGKGDLRTRRGKLFRGTYGKKRPRKKKRDKKAKP